MDYSDYKDYRGADLKFIRENVEKLYREMRSLRTQVDGLKSKLDAFAQTSIKFADVNQEHYTDLVRRLSAIEHHVFPGMIETMEQTEKILGPWTTKDNTSKDRRDS